MIFVHSWANILPGKDGKPCMECIPILNQQSKSSLSGRATNLWSSSPLWFQKFVSFLQTLSQRCVCITSNLLIYPHQSLAEYNNRPAILWTKKHKPIRLQTESLDSRSNWKLHQQKNNVSYINRKINVSISQLQFHQHRVKSNQMHTITSWFERGWHFI